MLVCISCGKEISAGAKFCNSCGSEQKKPSASCNSCGMVLEENENFCSGCGTPTSDASQTQASLKPKIEPKPQEKKVTKKEKQKIVTEPKLDQNPPTPPPPKLNPSEKKKSKKMDWLDISLRVLFVLLIVIAFLPDIKTNKTSNRKASTIDNASEVEAILEENDISTDEEIKQETIDDTQEVLLDINDENAADKYRYGINVENDQYKAVELYQKLADKGDLNAMVELADYYEQGIWVEKDSEMARQLLKKAADAGSIAAKWQLEFLESEK